MDDHAKEIIAGKSKSGVTVEIAEQGGKQAQKDRFQMKAGADPGRRHLDRPPGYSIPSVIGSCNGLAGVLCLIRRPRAGHLFKFCSLRCAQGVQNGRLSFGAWSAVRCAIFRPSESKGESPGAESSDTRGGAEPAKMSGQGLPQHLSFCQARRRGAGG